MHGKWNGYCYARTADPQPSFDDPVWGGRTDGVIIECVSETCVANAVAGTAKMCLAPKHWVAAGLGEVTPRGLAQEAVAQMQIRAPQIGMTGGRPEDGGMQIVGIPAWLWVADPGESTTGPVTQTATAGAMSVTATAVLDKTVWSMGDGVNWTCLGQNAAGTPWVYGYGGQPSPTCSYVYTRTSAGMPDEAFTVTVTAYWTVTWSGGGQSGTIPIEVHRSIQKRVGEVQSILVPNPRKS
ncbi:MAG: hypothetical protein LBU50_06040 [Cellulomonas sp.]|nr:hypothetical protein [Cellulomonas sp.]